MSFEINLLDGGLCAEVTGLDLRLPLADEDFLRLRDAWFNAGVMVARDQTLAPAEQVAFSSRFGTLLIHVLDQFLMPGQPEVLILSNDKAADGTPLGFEDAGRYWHSDLSYKQDPAIATMLQAIEVPPEGGDTLFANMYAAYDALPQATKDRIDGLHAFHSYTVNYKKLESREGLRPALTEEQKSSLADARHPIVRVHEVTGRKALYVNPGFTYRIEGMADDEAKALLDELFAHATRPEFIYTHKWRAGDFLCWDNRAVMHHATLYDPKYRRHIHRTTVGAAAA